MDYDEKLYEPIIHLRFFIVHYDVGLLIMNKYWRTIPKLI